MELDDKGHIWIDNISKELNSFIKSSGWTSRQLSQMLEIDDRNFQRMHYGHNEKNIRFARTEHYAMIFYHCGVLSADPRKIPVQAKSMTQAEYISWKKTQSEPLLITPLSKAISILEDTVMSLQEIVADEQICTAVQTVSKAQIIKLNQIARMLTLNTKDRASEMSVISLLKGEENEE